MKNIVEMINQAAKSRFLSAKQAGVIETFLLETYPDSDWASDAADALSQYRPGGGDSLYDYRHVAGILSGVKERLEKG